MKPSQELERLLSKREHDTFEDYLETSGEYQDDNHPLVVAAKQLHDKYRADWMMVLDRLSEEEDEEEGEEARMSRLNHDVVQAVREADEWAREYRSFLRMTDDPHDSNARWAKRKYEKALHEVKYAGMEAGLAQKQITILIQNANINM